MLTDMKSEFQSNIEYLNNWKTQISQVPSNQLAWQFPLQASKIDEVIRVMKDILRDQEAFEHSLKEITNMVNISSGFVVNNRHIILHQTMKHIMHLFLVVKWKFFLGWQPFSFH